MILRKAFELFMRYGIKSVTMDDIARELGISKKTLYQTVANKADLIAQIFQLHFAEEEQAMATIREQSSDAIEEMLGIGRYVVEKTQGMSPTVVYDLQKYYRSLWDEMQAKMKKNVYSIIIDNLERGIAQGLYRKDMQPDVVARLYVGKTVIAADEETFEACNHDMSTLHRELILYHMHGITSAKGRQLLDKHLAAEARQEQTTIRKNPI